MISRKCFEVMSASDTRAGDGRRRWKPAMFHERMAGSTQLPVRVKARQAHPA
jgi:hypothetical protein